MSLKNLAILGATGSIGTQALEVVDEQSDRLKVVLLSGHSNIKLLTEQAKKYKPEVVITTDESKYQELKDSLAGASIDIQCGQAALEAAVTAPNIDIVLAAMVGVAGLKSTMAAIKAGKKIALANKETLVVGGDIVMDAVKQYNATLIPVDSEHSAIFQCLTGEDQNNIEKIYLTASGGPFRGRKTNFLENVKKEHALQHPNWTMGAKITIDSATLMNKGLEMIEAKYLFGLENDQIDVIIHPQSIIHSIVEFKDGSQKAQMGLPSMKVPIQFAFSYPDRWQNDAKRCSFNTHSELTFEEPDYRTFRNLTLAIEAMKSGGTAPAILNAANEEVVQAFLDNKIGFLTMTQIIEEALQSIPIMENPTLDDLYEADAKARTFAQLGITKYAL